ncbi:MAG: 30S ribosomal protein S21 [Candidatus Azosocius agrarius]|nr:MAG: 30S ribosomal protein S21 [Gammaproteobacteria bacterium]
MTYIIVRDGEHLDSAIRRLKRYVEKSGIPRELRQRERYEKPAKKRQRELAAAKKRQLKKQKNLLNRFNLSFYNK